MMPFVMIGLFAGVKSGKILNGGVVGKLVIILFL